MIKNGARRNIQYYKADACPYGLTYGHWTVKWWQWFLSTPKSINPLVNDSELFASVNQPAESVWFLGGRVADSEKIVPKRVCTIPSSRSILFPVINCEVNSLECPQLTTNKQLLDHVTNDENTIILKECFVDGMAIPVQRVKSDPEIFDVEINEDNPYGVKHGGKTFAAADGFWVFLKPLPLGNHNILFRGSCENGKLNSGADYNIHIV
ncbi:MAG TPA: hypothetical protein VJ729_15315 [Nitrososphaeraceae archaeon]|nr:hypothetical protein [Nitrososphaeraceae archaeon]